MLDVGPGQRSVLVRTARHTPGLRRRATLQRTFRCRQRDRRAVRWRAAGVRTARPSGDQPRRHRPLPVVPAAVRWRRARHRMRSVRRCHRGPSQARSCERGEALVVGRGGISRYCIRASGFAAQRQRRLLRAAHRNIRSCVPARRRHRGARPNRRCCSHRPAHCLQRRCAAGAPPRQPQFFQRQRSSRRLQSGHTRWSRPVIGNRFGHPHPQVLARYRDAGTRVLQTSVHGAVRLRVERDGHFAAPECWRIRHRRFWFVVDADAAAACRPLYS
jgi:hypothetical protein